MKSSWLVPVCILTALLGLWEIGSRISGLPAFILPAPSRILRVSVVHAPQLLPHAGVTLMEIVADIALALACHPSNTEMYSIPFSFSVSSVKPTEAISGLEYTAWAMCTGSIGPATPFSSFLRR